MKGPLHRLRQKALGSGRSMLWASRFPGEQYTHPVGDNGLFGPDSPAWRVHSDTSMFVGGLSAILIQMLHPLAMAGVADHSNWVAEPIKRLSRTASFITATTFGSTPVAEAVIEQVRRRHARVSGTAPDGRPYRADDPALLCWVHTAQVASFLRPIFAFIPTRSDLRTRTATFVSRQKSLGDWGQLMCLRIAKRSPNTSVQCKRNSPWELKRAMHSASCSICDWTVLARPPRTDCSFMPQEASSPHGLNSSWTYVARGLLVP